MIDTYRTGPAAPPTMPPPHLGRSHQVLVPDPPPSQGHGKILLRFLAAVASLHLLLSLGGFLYLNLNMNGEMPRGKRLPAGGKAAYLSTDKQARVLAWMVVEHPDAPVQEFTRGFLQWDINHSFQRGIGYSYKRWLTVLEPGDYYVYSRVTFSRDDPAGVLSSEVKLRRNETREERTVMRAYCSLASPRGSGSGSGSGPRLCTASQGEVVPLERGNQLGVWVRDLSRVNYAEGATTFGMYKL